MITFALEMIFVVTASIFVFRTARENRYNAIGWTVAAVAAFFGTQIALSFAFVLVLLAIYQEAWQEVLVGSEIGYWMITTIPAGVPVLLILRHVNTIKDDHANDAPPPPSMFGLGD